MWRLMFIRHFDGETWRVVSEFHDGILVRIYSSKPKINHETYKIQQISDNYIRLTNNSQTIRIEFERVSQRTQ